METKRNGRGATRNHRVPLSPLAPPRWWGFNKFFHGCSVCRGQRGRCRLGLGGKHTSKLRCTLSKSRTDGEERLEKGGSSISKTFTTCTRSTLKHALCTTTPISVMLLLLPEFFVRERDSCRISLPQRLQKAEAVSGKSSTVRFLRYHKAEAAQNTFYDPPSVEIYSYKTCAQIVRGTFLFCT